MIGGWWGAKHPHAGPKIPGCRVCSAAGDQNSGIGCRGQFIRFAAGAFRPSSLVVFGSESPGPP